MTHSEWEPAGREGSQLAGYKLERCIETDALGEVYRASRGTRQFAVRVFFPEVSDDVDTRTTLLTDLERLKGVTHPALVRVHETGEEDDLAYVVSEWVEGTSLRDILDDKHHLEFEEAAPIVRLLLDGLSALHEIDLVHGFLTPDNVLIESGANGRRTVRLTAAGLWRLHVAGDPDARAVDEPDFYRGHCNYMSPEAIEGKALEPAADVYSAGIVLFELLTGRTPFDSPSPSATFKRHLVEDPIPVTLARQNLSIPDGLQDLMSIALGKKADQRFQSPQALKVALGSLSVVSNDEAEGYLPDTVLPRTALVPRSGKSKPAAVAPEPETKPAEVLEQQGTKKKPKRKRKKKGKAEDRADVTAPGSGDLSTDVPETDDEAGDTLVDSPEPEVVAEIPPSAAQIALQQEQERIASGDLPVVSDEPVKKIEQSAVIKLASPSKRKRKRKSKKKSGKTTVPAEAPQTKAAEEKPAPAKVAAEQEKPAPTKAQAQETPAPTEAEEPVEAKAVVAKSASDDKQASKDADQESQAKPEPEAKQKPKAETVEPTEKAEPKSKAAAKAGDKETSKKTSKKSSKTRKQHDSDVLDLTLPDVDEHDDWFGSAHSSHAYDAEAHAYRAESTRRTMIYVVIGVIAVALGFVLWANLTPDEEPEEEAAEETSTDDSKVRQETAALQAAIDAGMFEGSDSAAAQLGRLRDLVDDAQFAELRGNFIVAALAEADVSEAKVVELPDPMLTNTDLIAVQTDAKALDATRFGRPPLAASAGLGAGLTAHTVFWEDVDSNARALKRAAAIYGDVAHYSQGSDKEANKQKSVSASERAERYLLRLESMAAGVDGKSRLGDPQQADGPTDDGVVADGTPPTDGTLGPDGLPIDGTVPADGTLGPDGLPIDGTVPPTLGPDGLPIDGTVPPTDGALGPDGLPVDGTIPPTDGTLGPDGLPVDGTVPPTDGTVPPADGTTPPTDGTTPPTDGTTPPTDGTTVPPTDTTPEDPPEKDPPKKDPPKKDPPKKDPPKKKADSAKLAAEGFDALKAGKGDEAEKAFKAALKAKSSNAKALFGMGEVYWAKKDFAVASSWYKKATNKAPRNAKYFIKLGNSYIKLKRYEDALAAYTNAEKVARDSSSKTAAEKGKAIAKRKLGQ